MPKEFIRATYNSGFSGHFGGILARVIPAVDNRFSFKEAYLGLNL